MFGSFAGLCSGRDESRDVRKKRVDGRSLKIKTNIMDYTEFHNLLQFFVPGFTPEMLTKRYVLYFDETNNAKKFQIKDDDRLNVPVGVRFVLGGISCSDSLTQDEINKTLGLQKTSKELKFEKIYCHANWNDFSPALKSKKLTGYLTLLEKKGALIHFSSVNLFYYAMVDIIDSLDYDVSYTYALKSVLYQVAMQNPDVFVELFRDNTYPDVKDVDKFMNALAVIVNSATISDPIGKQVLLDVLISNMGKSELSFIQDEKPRVFIESFLHFYQDPLYMFTNSKIVFDNELDVVEDLLELPVEVNGEKINYQFVDSKSEPWVQMSDVAASLVARYLYFVEADDYMRKIESFTTTQLDNFKKLNSILAASERENKLFWHFVDDCRIVQRFSECVKRYQ